MQHIEFFFISSFTKDIVLYTASYDDGSSGITGWNCICDGSEVPWILSAMNPCQLGGLSMKELDNNQTKSGMSYKLLSSCDGSQAFANVFLNLDILGFSYIFTRPLTFAKSIIFTKVIVCFIIGCVESVLDLGYYEDIKLMTCVHALVIVSSLWSKLSRWTEGSIPSTFLQITYQWIRPWIQLHIFWNLIQPSMISKIPMLIQHQPEHVILWFDKRTNR